MLIINTDIITSNHLSFSILVRIIVFFKIFEFRLIYLFAHFHPQHPLHPSCQCTFHVFHFLQQKISLSSGKPLLDQYPHWLVLLSSWLCLLRLWHFVLLVRAFVNLRDCWFYQILVSGTPVPFLCFPIFIEEYSWWLWEDSTIAFQHS